MKQQIIKLTKIVENKGQIEGLPRNPRQIKDEKYKLLKKSIEDDPEMLELRELLVYPHNGKFVVIGGNMRLKALRELGVSECPCKVIPAETPIEKLRAYTIKDNNSFGEYDFDLLGNDWEVDELLDWGCDLPEITIEEEQPTAQEDDYSEEDAQNAESIVKRGEIWQLGEHRLMCGDSTCGGDVALLMNGEKADIAFSSPPYNAGTTATEQAMNKKTKYNGNDDNKTSEDYCDFLNKYIRVALENSENVFCNVQSISNNKIALIDVLYANKDNYADTIIWDKINGQPAMAENVLNSVFEYVHIFSHKANRSIGTIPFRGTLNNIIHLSGQRRNEFAKIHNATFSIEFASYFVQNFADKSVLDQFGGTGTTLIACEQLKRKCYMMELDPHYCDVIIDRWQKLTGKTAVKVEQQ